MNELPDSKDNTGAVLLQASPVVTVTSKHSRAVWVSINVYTEEENRCFLPWRVLLRFLSLCVCACVYVCVIHSVHSCVGSQRRRRRRRRRTRKSPCRCRCRWRTAAASALPRRCSREGILGAGWRCSSLLDVFPEAMRHLPPPRLPESTWCWHCCLSVRWISICCVIAHKVTPLPASQPGRSNQGEHGPSRERERGTPLKRILWSSSVRF